MRATFSSRKPWMVQIKRFCDVWLRASNRADKTVQGYRADLLQFVRQLPRAVGPKRLSRSVIEGWVVKLQKQGYASSSIRRKLASLRSFFTYLVSCHELDASPLRDLRFRLGTTERLTRVVPLADMRALVQSADRQSSHYSMRGLCPSDRLLRLRNALIVRLLGLTGIRVGELVALRVHDVRQKERRLLIHGKGNRERLAFVVDPTTACLLDRYLHARRTVAYDNDALLTNAASTDITTEGVRQILRAIGKAAGTTCRITPHMLRHTAATTLLENGVDLRIVQEFLGHDSIRSTERYTHVAPRHLMRVLRRVNPLRLVA